MPLEFIEHDGRMYPKHQAEGNAARWIMPMAEYYCQPTGSEVGLDIGFSKEEWKMPKSVGLDNGDTWNAFNVPIRRVLANDDKIEWDYIFSSHCLEHVKENWFDVIDHWIMRIKVGGIIFLYLPHASQTYWHPSSNRKHVHSFTGDEIGEYLRNLGHKVLVGGCDANHSFVVVCEKTNGLATVENVSKALCDVQIANELETYCKERGIDYIREGNNVIYNEKSPVNVFHERSVFEIFKIHSHEYKYHTFKITETTDGFTKNCAMVEVEFNGENYKTGYLVYPTQWDNDIEALYSVFDKMIYGIKMIGANK